MTNETAPQLPPLPVSEYGLCFYDEDGDHAVDGLAFTADQMRDYARAALAAQSPAVAHGWRPIGEAPKDGTEVWAFNGEQARMKWIQGDGYALWTWADTLLSETDPMPEQPTHFMPIPSGPVLDMPAQGSQP